MSLHRELNRDITYFCDHCSNELETGENDFVDAQIQLKSEDWRVYRGKDGDWYHKCRSCLRGNDFKALD